MANSDPRTIDVSGLSELRDALDQFAVNVEKKMLRGALRAGQKIILTAAQQNVPVDSGALRDSLRISTSARGDTVKATLKAGNKTAWYGHMVEFGTTQHYIRPKNAKSLFLAGLAREAVDHPGAQKKPFMRPALDNNAEAATRAFADYLAARIDKETAKTLAALPDEQDTETKS